MARLTCHFSGSVQGVGFRYTTANIARNYEVSGYVRNLPDGRVELVMEGTNSECRAMLSEIQEQLGMYVSDVRVNESPGTGEFTRFGIRH